MRLAVLSNLFRVMGVGVAAVPWSLAAKAGELTAVWTTEGPTGLIPQTVAGPGDVNGDGYDDLLVACNDCSHRGAAALYLGSASGLALTPTLLFESPTLTVDDNPMDFGSTMDGVGDLDGDGFDDVAVGAPNTDSHNGEAYVYFGSASGPEAPLTLAEDQYKFGWAVAGAGDVDGDGLSDFLVGNNDNSANVYLGGADRSVTDPAQNLVGDADSRYFGNSLGGGGDVNGDGYSDVLIGDSSDRGDHGRVYVMVGSALGVEPTAVATRSGGLNSHFGGALDNAGDVDGDGYDDVVVGAKNDGSWVGAAYVYSGLPTGISELPATTIVGQGSGYLGSTVAGAGDVDGDGFDDVVITAPQLDSNAGAAFLYLGSPTGLGAEADAALTSTGYMFGSSAAGLGDTNADGYSDFAVGQTEYGGRNGPGAAWVYEGNTSASTAAPLELDGVSSEERGYSIAAAGDLDGDGYPEAIIGAPSFFGEDGVVYVYRGGPDGLATEPTVTLGAIEDGYVFGSSVAGIGDVNGDGFDDVMIGALDSGENDYSKAYVYMGSASGLSVSPTVTIVGIGADPTLPYYLYGDLAGAGDLDLDGYDDVLVGASDGAILVFYGSADGLAALPNLTITVPDASVGTLGPAGDVNGDGWPDITLAAAGSSGEFAVLYGPDWASSTLLSTPTTHQQNVSGATVLGNIDINGDGYADLLVGDPGYNTDPENDQYGDGTGAVLIFLGSPEGLLTLPFVTLVGPEPSAAFGTAIVAGDVDGDAYGDVVISAPGFGDGGAVFVYLGTSSGLSADPIFTASGSGALGSALALGPSFDGGDGPDLLVADVTYNDSAGMVSLYDLFVDSDGDSVGATVDCDDDDPAVGTNAASWADSDGDGYGDPAGSDVGCEPSAGSVSNDSDCDDADAAAFPGATEIVCDGVDEACNGDADEGACDGDDSENPAEGGKLTPCGCAQAPASTLAALVTALSVLAAVRRRQSMIPPDPARTSGRSRTSRGPRLP